MAHACTARQLLALTGISILVHACGADPDTRSPRAPEASPASKKHDVPERSYCQRLQPQLNLAVRAAHIGTEMSCLDIPGVTELGRFGTANAGEEGTLSGCFDNEGDYQKLLETSESDFNLDIDQQFSAEVGVEGEAGLSKLLPWLPSVKLDASRARHITARVSLKHARFVTLLGVASRLQGQPRELQCLEALCRPGYSYVHKVLIGIPTLTLRAEDDLGSTVRVGAPLFSSGFRAREATGGMQEISAKAPVTLAMARSVFRTPQTERLCQFCGRGGQKCCSEGPSCNGGLGCFENTCVDVGGPDQPCDGERCSTGSCVSGRCRTACGQVGQPCCRDRVCSGALRCTPDPKNEIEPRLSSEEVTIGGGLFGTNEDRIFGSSSCGPLLTRGRFALTKLGTGRGECEKAWWFDPENQKDCRVATHFQVSFLGSIFCRIEVFAAPDKKPDHCEP